MKSIAKLSIKILSIYFFVIFISSSIPSIFGLLFSNMRQAMGIGVIAIITGYLIKLIIPIYLWFSADKLSNKIVKNEEEVNLNNIDFNRLQIIAFSVVGVILLAVNIPDFIKVVLQIFSLPGRIRVSSNILQNMIPQVIKIIIGVWLLFRPQGIIKYISKK